MVSRGWGQGRRWQVSAPTVPTFPRVAPLVIAAPLENAMELAWPYCEVQVRPVYECCTVAEPQFAGLESVTQPLAATLKLSPQAPFAVQAHPAGM